MTKQLKISILFLFLLPFAGKAGFAENEPTLKGNGLFMQAVSCPVAMNEYEGSANDRIFTGDSIFINEIMPSNSVTICDEDGDYPDWIELYNGSSLPVDLNGYMISDDEDEPDKWVFPSVVVGPHGYLLIFASGKNRLSGPYLHTNFKIKASGEPVLLSDPAEVLLDQVNAGQIDPDVSYGRKPDGSSEMDYFYVTSPGAGNAANMSYRPLEYSSDGGFYNAPFMLTLSTADTTTMICFTCDGSEPDPDSAGTMLYSVPISIYDATIEPNNISMVPTTPNPNASFPAWQPPAGNIRKAMVIRAATFTGGQRTSKVYTNTYFVDPDIFNTFTMPVFSIVTDSLNLFAYDSGIYVPGQFYDSTVIKSGNYYQTGMEWEKNIHLEYFSTTGERLLDQDAGMRMHGDLTLTAPLKSVKLYARSEYGDKKFRYPLFPDLPFEDYKRFILRTPFAAHLNTIITDGVIHDLAKDLDVDRMDVNPVLVFFNGEYWGIHTMRERQEKYYLEQHHGINPDSVDILGGWGYVLEGNAQDYSQLYQFVENNDLSVPENYEYVKTRIDIDSYIDYYITETYFGNHDWPGNNFKFWHPQTENGKWRYLLYDLDAAFKEPYINSLAQASTDIDTTGYSPYWATLIFRKLLENDSFLEQFVERYVEVVNTTFSTANVVARIDSFENIYIQELEPHIARWLWPSTVEYWKNRLESLRYFATLRPCVMKEQLEDFFDIDSVNIICDTTSSIVPPNDRKQFLIYPNPVKAGNILWVENSSGARVSEIAVFDITGRKIITYQPQKNKAYSTTIAFQVGNIKQGIYLVVITTANERYTARMVVE
jgi:hypothetical protein